jgi:hypothetical protein
MGRQEQQPPKSRGAFSCPSRFLADPRMTFETTPRRPGVAKDLAGEAPRLQDSGLTGVLDLSQPTPAKTWKDHRVDDLRQLRMAQNETLARRINEAIEYESSRKPTRAASTTVCDFYFGLRQARAPSRAQRGRVASPLTNALSQSAIVRSETCASRYER